MTVGINCGHTTDGAGLGAVGIIKENRHTRLVGQALMRELMKAGIEVIDCTIDRADTQKEYLEAVVTLANRQELDWFISIHFNASKDHSGHGVEIYTYKGRKYPDAINTCEKIAGLGFRNRGVKEGSGLYVIRKTKAKVMLIEVCFCDNETDINQYNAIGGAETIAKTIGEVIAPYGKKERRDAGTPIMGKSIAKAEQLNTLLLRGNPDGKRYLYLAEIFLEEGEKEGVRGDGAYCQALIETGYFKFGGDVQPDQHNYAGLGATGKDQGLSFSNDRTGIRAQIQHLKGYGSREPLKQRCVDPRYKYISKGCAPTFEQLSGKWAVPGYSGYANLEAAWQAKDSYGDHITRLLNGILQLRC